MDAANTGLHFAIAGEICNGVDRLPRHQDGFLPVNEATAMVIEKCDDGNGTALASMACLSDRCSIALLPPEMLDHVGRSLSGPDILNFAATHRTMSRWLQDYQVVKNSRAALQRAVSTADLLNVLYVMGRTHVDLRRPLLQKFADHVHLVGLHTHYVATLDALRAALRSTWTGDTLAAGLRDLLIVECYMVGMRHVALNLEPAWEAVRRHSDPSVLNRCIPFFFSPAFHTSLGALPIAQRAAFFEAIHPMLGDAQFLPELTRFVMEFEGPLAYISDGFALVLAEALLMASGRTNLRNALLQMGVTETQLTEKIDRHIEAKLFHRIACGQSVPYDWCERWRPGDEDFLGRNEAHFLGLHREEIRRTRSWKELFGTDGSASDRIIEIAGRLVCDLEVDTLLALPKDPRIINLFVGLHARTGSLETNRSLFEAYREVTSAPWAMQPALMDRLSSHLWQLLPTDDTSSMRARRRTLRESLTRTSVNEHDKILQANALHAITQITIWREACVAICLLNGAPRLAARAYVAEMNAWINLGDVVPNGVRRVRSAVVLLADRAFSEIPLNACGELLDRLCRVRDSATYGFQYASLPGYLERFVADQTCSACCPSMSFSREIIAIAAECWMRAPQPTPAGVSRFDAFCARYDLRNHDRDRAWYAILDNVTTDVGHRRRSVEHALAAAGFDDELARAYVEHQVKKWSAH